MSLLALRPVLPGLDNTNRWDAPRPSRDLRAHWVISLIRPLIAAVGLAQGISGAYHGLVSTSWQGQEPEPQWNQPPFAPGFQEPEPPGYQTRPQFPARPPLPDVVTGSVLVPHAQIPPPGIAESTLRVLAGLVWPVVIAIILIFGGGNLWFGIVFAIIASALIKQGTRELKRRRVLGARIIPPTGQQDLR